MAKVRSETSDLGVATVTIDREDKRNALDRETLRELGAAFEAVAVGREVKVIVLRGAGDKAFCAGADLKEMLDHETIEARRDQFDGVRRVIEIMHRLPQPVISRVPGYALAGGCGLAVAADFTIASESAVLGLPEIGLALLPLVVSAPIYRSLGSRKVLLDLVLTGRRVGAAEALRLGLVTRVVPDEALDAAIGELCAKLAGLSPAAVRMGKEAIYTMSELEYGAALKYLRETVLVQSMTEDAQEGMRAFFEKREPNWIGR